MSVKFIYVQLYQSVHVLGHKSSNNQLNSVTVGTMSALSLLLVPSKTQQPNCNCTWYFFFSIMVARTRTFDLTSTSERRFTDIGNTYV